MKIGLLLKTDNGSWALSDEEALELLGYAHSELMNQWEKMRDEGKKPSGRFYEMLETVKEIRNSMYNESN